MPEPLPPSMVGFEASLAHHLQYNHFPPVHVSFVPVAVAAISVAQEAVYDGPLDLLDQDIEMVNGVVLPVRRIMDELHLWAYVSVDEDE